VKFLHFSWASAISVNLHFLLYGAKVPYGERRAIGIDVTRIQVRGKGDGKPPKRQPNRQLVLDVPLRRRAVLSVLQDMEYYQHLFPQDGASKISLLNYN